MRKEIAPQFIEGLGVSATTNCANREVLPQQLAFQTSVETANFPVGVSVELHEKF